MEKWLSGQKHLAALKEDPSSVASTPMVAHSHASCHKSRLFCQREGDGFLLQFKRKRNSETRKLYSKFATVSLVTV